MQQELIRHERVRAHELGRIAVAGQVLVRLEAQQRPQRRFTALVQPLEFRLTERGFIQQPQLNHLVGVLARQLTTVMSSF